MSAAAFALLFLLVGVGGALVLLALVRSEAAGRQRMDRTSAERAARRDTQDDGRRRT